jgi:hypothetical protein
MGKQTNTLKIDFLFLSLPLTLSHSLFAYLTIAFDKCDQFNKEYKAAIKV